MFTGGYHRADVTHVVEKRKNNIWTYIPSRKIAATVAVIVDKQNSKWWPVKRSEALAGRFGFSGHSGMTMNCEVAEPHVLAIRASCTLRFASRQYAAVWFVNFIRGSL